MIFTNKPKYKPVELWPFELWHFVAYDVYTLQQSKKANAGQPHLADLMHNLCADKLSTKFREFAQVDLNHEL